MAPLLQRGWRPLSAALDALGVLAFACVFGAINLQVFMRYVVHQPVSWSEEFPTLAFAVAVLWAAAVTLRAADHIVFELLTDALPRNLQVLVLALYMKVLSSPILRIRYDFVFGFFAFFIGMVALRSAAATVLNLVRLVRGETACRQCGTGDEPGSARQGSL